MAAGEFFGKPQSVSDSLGIVINEKQALELGWAKSADALGNKLGIIGDPRTYTIKGVIKDFNFNALTSGIKPLCFINIQITYAFRVFSFKLKPEDIHASLTALQNKWNTLLPGAPFDYKFMDESLANLYKNEIRLKKASNFAFCLSLIIMLLGITGMVSISIQKRKKEIAIRKVLGSSVKSIVNLFIMETIPVIVISGLIACPIAYLFMKKWLDNYAYKVSLSPLPFAFAILFLTIISTLLIILQTIRSASSNPIESLRTE